MDNLIYASLSSLHVGPLHGYFLSIPKFLLHDPPRTFVTPSRVVLSLFLLQCVLFCPFATDATSSSPLLSSEIGGLSRRVYVLLKCIWAGKRNAASFFGS